MVKGEVDFSLSHRIRIRKPVALITIESLLIAIKTHLVPTKNICIRAMCQTHEHIFLIFVFLYHM